MGQKRIFGVGVEELNLVMVRTTENVAEYLGVEARDLPRVRIDPSVRGKSGKVRSRDMGITYNEESGLIVSATVHPAVIERQMRLNLNSIGERPDASFNRTNARLVAAVVTLKACSVCDEQMVGDIVRKTLD